MKYLLALLIGAGAGVIGTYLYFNNKVETMVEKKVNEEMAKFFDSQAKTMSADDVEEVEEEKTEEVKVSDRPETQEKTSIQKMDNDIRTNYRNPDKEEYHGNDGIEEDEDFEDEEYITDEEVEELMAEAQSRMEQQPHIITEEEQDTTLIGYDNEEYFWHPKGNIICDKFDHELEEKDLLDILFEPIDWKKELKDKQKIIIRVPSEATNYTVWNEDLN